MQSYAVEVDVEDLEPLTPEPLFSFEYGEAEVSRF